MITSTTATITTPTARGIARRFRSTLTLYQHITVTAAAGREWTHMKMRAPLAAASVCAAAFLLVKAAEPEPAPDSLIAAFSRVEVASVADAMEQLYGQKAYMSHDMRPLATTKFAGPAVTVLLKKEEHHEGAKASQGMLDAIDAA